MPPSHVDLIRGSEILENTVRDLVQQLSQRSSNDTDPFRSASDNGELQSSTTPPCDYRVEDISPMNTSHTAESPNKAGSRASRPSNEDMLSLRSLSLVCNEWFAVYHPWCPILHQPSYLDALQKRPFVLGELPNLLTFKAIAAVVYQNRRFSTNGNQHVQAWSSVMRRKIIKKAMTEVSLPSMQALLILSVMDFAAGKFHDFWNLVALFKRYA